jgi:hypothetical protein
VSSGASGRRGWLIVSLCLMFAVPGFAATAVDPGSFAMLWHIFGGAAVIAILNWRHVGVWLQENAGIRSRRSAGFVFAVFYACVTTPIIISITEGHVIPRFNDIFLVGIVFTCYFFTWESATTLLALSMLITAWILPPNGDLRVEGFNEWYRLISFTLVSAMMIMLLTRIKARGSVTSQPERAMAMRAASGD